MNFKFLSFLKKKLFYLILLVLGVCFLLVAIVNKLSHDLLIIIAVFGGLLVAFAAYKTVKKEVEESALDKDKLKRVSEDYEVLKQQHLKVISENKSLHDMKINVSDIKPLVEIGLFEAETEFTQFVDQYFDEHFNEIHDEGMIKLIETNPSNYVERYGGSPIRISGALHFNIDAIYGIKVDEVAIKTYAENGHPKVKIHGAKPRFLSFKSRNVVWKSPIALKYSVPMLLGQDTWKTDKNIATQYNRYIDNYREKIIKESEKGPKELEWIKKPLEEQIKSMLNLLFFKNYAIEFVDEFTDDFISLNEFANSKLIEDDNLALLSDLSEKKEEEGEEK